MCDHVGIMNQGKVLLERSLVRAAGQHRENPGGLCRGGGTAPCPRSWRSCTGPPWEGCIPTSSGASGRSILHRMQALSPLLLEAIPLTLEEIFIYELGGADYAVREIIL